MFHTLLGPPPPRQVPHLPSAISLQPGPWGETDGEQSGAKGSTSLGSRGRSVQMEDGQAAYLLVGTCQLLLQGGDSLQGCPKPLSHLPEVGRQGEMEGDVEAPLGSG